MKSPDKKKRQSFSLKLFGDDPAGASVRSIPMHKERLAKALAKIINRTRQDSLTMRFWDGVMLCAISFSYIRWTITLFDDGHDPFAFREVSPSLGLFLSCLYGADVYIRLKVLHPRDRAQYSFLFHAFNVFTAIPWDIISFAASWNHILKVIGSIQATRVLLIPTLFRSDSPDVVDVIYIHFYYMLLPKIKVIVFTALCLHTLTVLHVLSIGGHEEEYRSSLMWVWILITSAPLSITTESGYETALAGFLMLLSMMVQGYFVSTVSTLLLGFNMQEQSRTHMLITLEMLRYYKVPRELQEEVLSFQYHVLQDSSMQTQFAPELERLPPAMLMEIDLYVKVGVLDKVTFFDAAPKSCKRKMAMVMHQLMVDPMTAVITAGEVGNSMYFMLHGLADVTLPNGIIVATIRRGDFFGEMALVNADAKRTATVCALTFCDILELTKHDFDAAIEEFPEFFEVINSRRTTRMEQSMRIFDDDEMEDSDPSSDIDLSYVGGPLGGQHSYSGDSGGMRHNSGNSLPKSTDNPPNSWNDNKSQLVSSILQRANQWGHKRHVVIAEDTRRGGTDFNSSQLQQQQQIMSELPNSLQSLSSGVDPLGPIVLELAHMEQRSPSSSDRGNSIVSKPNSGGTRTPGFEGSTSLPAVPASAAATVARDTFVIFPKKEMETAFLDLKKQMETLQSQLHQLLTQSQKDTPGESLENDITKGSKENE